MKSQILFSREKIKKIIINLSSAESAHRGVMVNILNFYMYINVPPEPREGTYF